jgi:transcriptional regulator with XRE-family HTH domain
MTQSELADAAGLGLSTIVDFEKERRQVSKEAVEAIQNALIHAGITFTELGHAGEGVMLQRSRHPRKK